jgi:L-asparaginase
MQYAFVAIHHFGLEADGTPLPPVEFQHDSASRQAPFVKPNVLVIGLGGTIAMTSEAGGGLRPTLKARDIIGSASDLRDVARIDFQEVNAVASVELALADVAALAARIRSAASRGVEGVVVVQGTDALEDTAFALDLLLDGAIPVVVTGAMRGAGAPGADGPANLAAAIRVAASSAVRGMGVLVVINDEIHAARFVEKRHTSSLAAFQSPGAGVLGRVSEGRVRVLLRPADAAPTLCWGEAAPRVVVIPVAAGTGPEIIAAVSTLDPDGAVVAGLGAGHAPGSWAEPLMWLAEKIPVVLSSRTGAGDVFTRTYGYAGGEIDLLGRGLVASGSLGPGKARILLAVLLSAGADRGAIKAAFDAW